MNYRVDNGLTKLRKFISDNHRWMYIFQPIGILSGATAIFLCVLVIFHVLEASLFIAFLAIVFNMLGGQLYLFGKAYNNEGDIGENARNISKIYLIVSTSIIIILSISLVAHFSKFY